MDNETGQLCTVQAQFLTKTVIHCRYYLVPINSNKNHNWNLSRFLDRIYSMTTWWKLVPAQCLFRYRRSCRTHITTMTHVTDAVLTRTGSGPITSSFFFFFFSSSFLKRQNSCHWCQQNANFSFFTIPFDTCSNENTFDSTIQHANISNTVLNMDIADLTVATWEQISIKRLQQRTW